MSTPLSREEFQEVLPPQLRKNIHQSLIDQINSQITDPEFMERYRENILGYVNVLQMGKFKMENYLAAVRYVSYKLMGDSNIVAYSKTFPDKIQDFNARKVDKKDIASYVSAYNKSKLVVLIFEQTLIPAHIMNADIFQEAVNKQATLMRSAQSEMVQHLAAKELMNILKKPESTKIELNVGANTSQLDLLREQMVALAEEQQKAIREKVVTAQEMAHRPLTIEGELDDDD